MDIENEKRRKKRRRQTRDGYREHKITNVPALTNIIEAATYTLYLA